MRSPRVHPRERMAEVEVKEQKQSRNRLARTDCS